MRERIRVAHILPWPEVGGTEIATVRIAKLLVCDRFEHVPYILSGENGCRRLFAGEGFETREFTAVEPSWRHPGPWWRASWALAQDMRRRGITLMHCANVLAAHYAAWAGRLAGLPVLSHVRGRFETIFEEGQNISFASAAVRVRVTRHMAPICFSGVGAPGAGGL